MKILYHHRTLADGAEGIHIASMVDGFTELGHQVRVEGLAALQDRPGRRTPVSVVRRWLPGPAFELASAAVNLAEYLRVRREIARFGPDMLYKRHARYDVGTLLAARHAGIPSVLEVNSLFTQGAYHGFEPTVLKSLALRMERQALQLATVVIAVSSPLARQIEMLVQRPVVVMPNSADPTRFDPSIARPERVRERHHLPGRLTIGWTGILREWHGAELLLDALKSVPDAQLLIVGDGPARGAFEQRAAAVGLGDRVVVTGRVAHEEMLHYIAAMDIAVVAAEKTGVASPMKLLEYMSMARAVVAPRLDNISDIVEEGRDALLFAAGDARDLSSVLQQLAADETLRRRLGRAARAKVQATRNWRRNAQEAVSLVTAAREAADWAK